jgi:hypothetical protein
LGRASRERQIGLITIFRPSGFGSGDIAIWTLLRLRFAVWPADAQGTPCGTSSELAGDADGV